MADNENFVAEQNPETDDKYEEGEEEEEEESLFEDEEEKDSLSELHSSLRPTGEERGDPQSETLEIPYLYPSSETDHHADFAFSSRVEAGFSANYTSQSLDSSEFKEQVGVSNQELLAIVIAQSTEAQVQNQVQLSGCPTSYELSLTSVTQPVLSAPSPIASEQILPPIPNVNHECMTIPEVDLHNSPDLRTIPVKTTSDGYNWRKYGQKQVKCPEGSRSYYKCTFTDCYAKKIECSDHVGHVIEIIYKGRHDHEPPRKVNSTREIKLASSAGPVVRNIITHSVRMVNDSEPSTSSKERTLEASSAPERKRQNLSESNGSDEIDVKEEQVDEPEPKRRLMKSSSGSGFKPGKKPKFVVHAAGDIGISSDGYRWRKYGQKMVKGNPHPRNYYRCTSAGCPVRKHIESAIDNTNALIITYKGVHDHDMPVPKKRHGPPSAHLVAASAPASMNNLQIVKTDDAALQNHTQWSVDMEGELTGETMELGGDKAMESARTLLSIGFEIKPC